MSLLEVENLKISFDSRRGHTDAVKGISFKIDDGESVAIVGESGSGKSVTAMSLMRLLPPPPICSVSGKILCGGKNVCEMTGAELRKARGGEIAYIFQEPSTSFNPLFTVGSQIAEAVRLHSPKGTDVEKTVADSLAEVGIRDAALRARSYPYEMSGGMLQRAMIAMALACRPKLLVAGAHHRARRHHSKAGNRPSCADTQKSQDGDSANYPQLWDNLRALRAGNRNV